MGSEMCIRDRCKAMMRLELPEEFQLLPDGRETVEVLFRLASEDVRFSMPAITLSSSVVSDFRRNCSE